MDGGAWWAAVHGVAKSPTQLSDFTFTFHFHALEKEMATHSSVLAWRIPGTGEPGGLPSLGSHRVGHDWSDLAAVAADLSWKVLDDNFLWNSFQFGAYELYVYVCVHAVFPFVDWYKSLNMGRELESAYSDPLSSHNQNLFMRIWTIFRLWASVFLFC